MLVYALDRREPEKRERAREVLRLVVGAAAAPAPRLCSEIPYKRRWRVCSASSPGSAQRARTTRSRDSIQAFRIEAFRRASGSLSAARDASAEPPIREVAGSRVERVPIIPSLHFYL